MALEDMSINEVLVRYLHNMTEIEHLRSENAQISTNKDSIQEPRYVEDLSQWEEYRATKEEITRLTDERIASNNEKRQALFKEQQGIRVFLLNNERVPKDKWIRCADDGVYIPSGPANGEPAVRVAPWGHVMETNGKPERLDEVRREKESTVWGKLESVRRDPRRKPIAWATFVILIVLTLMAGAEGFFFGVTLIGVLAVAWFMDTRKRLPEAKEQLHGAGTGEQLSVAQATKRVTLLGLLCIMIAFLLPPLSVLLQVGIRRPFWINVLLTIFGYFPGIIHALWVVVKRLPGSTTVPAAETASLRSPVSKPVSFTSEAEFEDWVIEPLLKRWDFGYRKQYPCRFRLGSQDFPGRVDFYVSDDEGPIALFENKRRIITGRDLDSATDQGKSYALMLGLPCFVVASPEGLWVYSLNRNRERLERHISISELERKEAEIRNLLLNLR